MMVVQVLAVDTSINHGAAKKWMIEKQVLTVAPSINHGAENKHDALQMLNAVTSINHVAAKSLMRYKCSLSHQATIMELRKTMDYLPMLTVATNNWLNYKLQH
jgi:hypothetical protein